jgi:Alpha/beta hydrolase family
MTAPIETASGLTVDVSDALPFGDERCTLAADVHLPTGPARAALICWPGGSYSRSYWDMRIPGHSGYSFAEHMAARGFLVINADHLGVGGSSRPADVDAVTLEVMAAANAEFAREVRRRLAAGDLDDGLPPIAADVPLVGVGHSLGGGICVIAQALHGCYDGVANLGFTHGSKDVLEDGPMASVPDPEGPRKAAEEQAKAFFGDTWDAGYSLAPRAPNHSWLYAADVPAAVIAADDLTATAWPRQSYVEGLLVGFTAPYAAQVRSPVFIAFGDQDLPARPRDDAGFYTGSDDITVVTLPNSAHCHNFASGRTALWDRLGAWATELS